MFGGTQAGTASGCLNISEQQLTTIDHVWFQRCQPAIHGANIAGQSTVATIRNSTFTIHTGPAIIGCGETWSFINDTWEPDVNGRANAFNNAGIAIACKSLLFDNPWMGDVTVNGGTWITFLGNGLEIRGGRITANTAVSNEGISISSGSTGIKVSGPTVFENLSAALDFNNGTVTGVEVGGGITFLNVPNKWINLAGVTGFALAEGNSPSTSRATAGQLFIGQNAADAAWITASGDLTNNAAGAFTVTKTNGVLFGTAATQNTGTSGGTIPLLNAANTWSATQAFAALTATTFSLTNLAASNTAPTATTFCTSPSIPSNNGTAAFTINVGTACATSVGTITLPSAATGWMCDFANVTNPASNVVSQTGGTAATVTMTNYARTTGVASNWTSSDVIRAKCLAY
jgi:hypothetical protein